MSITLYVEGGGYRALDTELRKAFQIFLTAAGVVQRPRVVACGSRQAAYTDFCNALATTNQVLLLVDAEAAVATAHAQGTAAQWQPWAHLLQRDGWACPNGATDLHCHLMVECMENWLLADPNMLSTFFGNGFDLSKLPKPGQSVEALGKVQTLGALKAATQGCKTKGQYGKGAHSFKLLALISPVKLLPVAPWAQRLVDALR